MVAMLQPKRCPDDDDWRNSCYIGVNIREVTMNTSYGKKRAR